MKAYTAAQIRTAEQPLIAAGVPLMRRAAAALADEIRGVIEDRGTALSDAHVLMLIGPGDNGGDALFAGQDLADSEVHVHLLPVADHVHEAGLQAALDAGATLAAPVGADTTALRQAATRQTHKADVIVDGILGTGTRHGAQAALRGGAATVIDAVLRARGDAPASTSSSDTPSTGTQPLQVRALADPLTGEVPTTAGRAELRAAVIAVDLPSGIDPDSGEAPSDVVLPADLTVTFGAAKTGLLQGAGRRLAGELSVIDIGLGPQLANIEPALEVAGQE